MGMFDEIRCKYKLPGTLPDFLVGNNEPVFQTKDIECAMLTFDLSEEGYLSLQNCAQDFTGEVNFYRCLRRENPHRRV